MLLNNWLLESLQTIKNLADTAALAKNTGNERLIFTQLELLYMEAEQLVQDFCVEENGHANSFGFVDK